MVQRETSGGIKEMSKSEIICGRELQWALEYKGINALWIKNRGYYEIR